MGAPYNPPKKGEDFVVRITLDDVANQGRFLSNPTIVAGDFKVVTDAAAPANLATLPTVSPSGGVWVLITVSASEMNGDVICIQGIDQSNPQEWGDVGFCIPTTA